MTSHFIQFLERTLYRFEEPPPRKRNASKPMQVICPGFPRSGTESLQVALLKLGYDHTYHGWDIIFEDSPRMRTWAALCRRKYRADASAVPLSAADFDAVLGHSTAVVDAAASCFARDLILAYPSAKVILNTRRDLAAWHKSATDNLLGVNENWSIWWTSWWTCHAFWSWNVYERLLWPMLFRAWDGADFNEAVRRNGIWVYEEHVAMVRGLVPKERLLEWSVEDGWEPLCEFLDRPVPDEPFPNVNGPAGFGGRVAQWTELNDRLAKRNFRLFSSVMVIGVAAVTWRLAPQTVSSWATALKSAVDSLRL